MNEKSTKDYKHLQTNLDKVIGKIGLERTIYLTESFIKNTAVSFNETEKIKMISRFLSNLAIETFELEAESFYISVVREYRDARMCCFHLLRKYTGDTFSKIGLGFQRSERCVSYGFNVVEERLSASKSFTEFVGKYSLLESKLLEFIGKLN